MGSVRSTFHAVATSSCQGRAAIWHSPEDPQLGKEIWGPPRCVTPPSPCPRCQGHPRTHIEEADVHVEVYVHVIDGPVLPVKTQPHGGVTVPGRAGLWGGDGHV